MAYITLIITGVIPILSCVLSAILSSKLTNYKIDELQKNVDKLSVIITDTAVFKEQIKIINYRIKDLEDLQNAKKT